VATLIRVCGDFDVAEDAVQEAFTVALRTQMRMAMAFLMEADFHPEFRPRPGTLVVAVV
jgi:hypothetical protein